MHKGHRSAHSFLFAEFEASVISIWKIMVLSKFSLSKDKV